MRRLQRGVAGAEASPSPIGLLADDCRPAIIGSGGRRLQLSPPRLISGTCHLNCLTAPPLAAPHPDHGG
ncbi:hypothetical protein IC232_23425 [Microvirga sp. BT688]|uniref:hypothetical protein n=1 Tax=Microvirga sp. TaxID=1873136 RepID=UPI001684B4DE|nr:hypothetical protein [Microvirga sp.]MBD2749633.1 hypothetical protein [Microvirga sp.]